jgi:hypothetical protein
MLIVAAGYDPTGFATCFKNERHTRSQPPPPILGCPGQLPFIGRTKSPRRIAERLKTQRPQHRFVPDHGTPDIKLHIVLARTAGRAQGFSFFLCSHKSSGSFWHCLPSTFVCDGETCRCAPPTAHHHEHLDQRTPTRSAARGAERRTKVVKMILPETERSEEYSNRNRSMAGTTGVEPAAAE